jgi:uncharacterized protein (TIGR03437 family)
MELLCLWSLLLIASPQADTGAPFYTAASLANSASNTNGPFAPNAFLTIYGQNLAFNTVAISADDMHGIILPTALIGSGVRVLINSILADMYYASPTQVNLLVPTSLLPGPAVLQLVVDGLAGPPVSIQLSDAAPALFQLDAATALATHASGALVTAASPASAGEVIVLWATGLGPTMPASTPNELPQTAAALARIADFRVLLNGVPLDPSRVLYAGAAPGFAGLFQINVHLPDDAPSNPEVRVSTGSMTSPASRTLLIQ